MNIKNYLLIAIVLLSNFLTFSQSVKDKSLQIAPYAGLSAPSGNLKSFSNTGFVAGLSIDNYLNSKFALGLDFNYQSNSFKSSYDFSGISSPYTILESQNGNWSTSTLTLGPTYKLGSKKFSAEIYSKAGVSYTKSPNYDAVLTSGSFSKSILNLPEQKRTSFGLTSGIRFNYNISNKLSLFLNPQYVYSSSKVEYCNCGLDNLNNPDLIVNQEPIKETFSPSFINVNAGVKWSLGGSGNNSNPKKTDEVQNIENESLCDNTVLKSPYNGETYFADSDVVPEFRWINHSKPKVKSYVFEMYYGDKQLIKEVVTSNSFKFTKKLTTDFYKVNDYRDYSWRVTTNYSNCESTTTDFYYFTIQPNNNVSRSSCTLDLRIGDVVCSSPAYTETGMVKYTGTLTVTNNTPNLPGILIPHTSSLGPVQLFGTNNSNATLTFSQGGFSSPCPATPMLNTIHGPALAPNSYATYCFELEVPYGTTSIKFYANMNTYKPGEDLPAVCPTNATIELPVCYCDACENWNFTEERHSSTYDAANNNPYLSHSILQSFKLPGIEPIKNMKAEIVYVQHAVNNPKCYSCTTQVKDMGLFSAVIAKPKDILANPLDWINNNEGILDRDQNNDHYSNRIKWQARNPITGVDFATRSHNFNLYINLPGDNSFECCNHQYVVWIRYTFEDINCISCSTVIKYDLSENSSSSSGNSGTGSGVINSGMSNHQGGSLSPTQLKPKN